MWSCKFTSEKQSHVKHIICSFIREKHPHVELQVQVWKTITCGSFSRVIFQFHVWKWDSLVSWKCYSPHLWKVGVNMWTGHLIHVKIWFYMWNVSLTCKNSCFWILNIFVRVATIIYLSVDAVCVSVGDGLAGVAQVCFNALNSGVIRVISTASMKRFHSTGLHLSVTRRNRLRSLLPELSPWRQYAS